MLTTWHLLSAKKLVLTSLTSGGRSVGIVRLQTEATGFCSFVYGRWQFSATHSVGSVALPRLQERDVFSLPYLNDRPVKAWSLISILPTASRPWDSEVYSKFSYVCKQLRRGPLADNHGLHADQLLN
jgi:hypothetical protein